MKRLKKSKKFLELVGLSEKYPNGIVGDVIVEFEKIPKSSWDEEQYNKRDEFFKNLSTNYSDKINKPFILLLKDLVQYDDKFATFDVDDSYTHIKVFECSGKITSVSIEIPDETKQEEPVPAPEEKKTETETAPDEVEDVGLPEGDFADEILTGNKKEEPGWFKKLLTREKTDLMKNLKFLDGKLIEVNNIGYKITKVRASKDKQGILVFTCRQQRVNADLLKDPKFKFFGRKDFYLACKSNYRDSIFYDLTYRYNTNNSIYYGNSFEEIKNETNSLEEFVFNNICKYLNPND